MNVIRVTFFPVIQTMRISCLLDRGEQRPRAGSTLVVADGGVLQVEEVVEDDATERATDRVTLLVRAVPAEGEKPWAPYRVHEGYVLRELRDKDVSPSLAPAAPETSQLRVEEVKSVGNGSWYVTVDRRIAELVALLDRPVTVRRLHDGEPFDLIHLDFCHGVFLVQRPVHHKTSRAPEPQVGDVLLVTPGPSKEDMGTPATKSFGQRWVDTASPASEADGVFVVRHIRAAPPEAGLVVTFVGSVRRLPTTLFRMTDDARFDVIRPLEEESTFFIKPSSTDWAMRLNVGDKLSGKNAFERAKPADGAWGPHGRLFSMPEPAPVPMILSCPVCHGRHIDRGAFATKPHHTHACQHCGVTWRPAIVPTVGVQFLPGFKDEES